MSELIAEARVLVTPDTTAFRTQLIAQTTAAAKGVTVPVTVTPVVTGAAAASQAASAAGFQASAAAAERVTASSAQAAQSQAQLARAADLVAVAERRAAASLSEVSAAQIRYQASVSATNASLKAYQLAFAQSDVALGKKTLSTLKDARANETHALTALQDARATAVQTAALTRSGAANVAALGGISKGAGSAAASLVGVRGATLAANAPFLAGAAAAISFAKAVQLATSFNSEIAVLGAVTGATGVELDRAAEAAREFGRDITLPGVTAGDAAKTITEFSKAGLDLNDAIAATRGGLQLAQAAQLDYAAAVELSANALNAFNLEGDQAVHVADVLANAANLAQGGIEDTALALRQAAAAAEVVGVSFEDTSALLTLLARNGLTGSDAGTSLRTAFLRLVNPSKKANEVLESLNVNIRDLDGNVRPEIFAEFAKAQENLSVKTQQANAAIVFGQDAFRAFGILGKEGLGGLQEVQFGLEETGTAARVAGARMTGLAGAQENLSNQLSALGETIGQIAIPPLTFLVDELARFFEAGNKAVGVARDLGDAFGDIKLPERPPGVDPALGFLGDVFKTGFKIGNPAGQLLFIRDQFVDTSEEVSADVREAGIGLRQAILDASQGPARGQLQNVGTNLREALQRAAGIAVGGIDEFGARVAGAFQPAFDEINQAIRAAAATTRLTVGQSIQRSLGQAAGLEEVFDQVIAGGGGLAAQRSELERQAKVQADIIRKAGPAAQGDILKARRAAQAELARINEQIRSIDEQVANDQKAAAKESARVAKEAADERSRIFLERQGDARSRQERLVGLASETAGLQDDIRRRQSLRVLITQQIKAIRDSALGEKDKQAAIRALVAEKQKTSDEINALTRQQAQNNREQAEAAQEEREAANIALGESILDLTGNKNPLIRAIDAAVKDAIRTRNAAKKGSIEATKAQTEINNLLKRRRDILEDVEEDKDGGPTLVDLFNQAEDILGGAGNVGFNAAGLQGLSARPRIQMEVQQRLDIVNNPALAAAERQKQSTDRLIAAIDTLTNAITGNSTAGTVREGPVGPQNRSFARSVGQETRFYLQRQAEAMVDAGLVG